MSKTSTSNVISNVALYIKKNQLFAPDQTIIVGLSGGPDSVFLLYALVELRDHMNLKLIAAHLDHGWRKDSHKDVLFCQRLCKKLKVAFVHKHAREITLTRKPSGSQEELGRLLRRAFFESVFHEYHADTIALAHHRDDTIETFFIRLMRGAGLAGLSGIKPKDGHYVRPLLDCTKTDIIEWLTAQKIPYLTDPSNAENIYLRNKIRNIALPALRACDQRFDRSAIQTIARLQSADDFVQHYTQTFFSSISTTEDGVLWIDYKKLLNEHPYIQHQCILHWLITTGVVFTPTTRFFDEIIRFLKNTKSSRHSISTEWTLYKKSSRAALKPV